MSKALVFLFIGLALSSVQAKTTYILAVDGLSYDAFTAAKKMGYFKELSSVSAHIAPFPSMTDLSWSEVTLTSDIFGKPGRIHSVEAVYLDESTKTVEGDIRDYYRRLAQPKYYLNAFQNVFNPYVEALMYFPTIELPLVEIRSVLDGMSSTTGKAVVTGYIGAIDSTAHTQKNRLFDVIQQLDEQIGEFVKKQRAGNEEFELIVISDHGNIGTYGAEKPRTEEPRLVAVEIGSVIQSLHMNFVGKLSQDNDVAMPLLALGNWGPVYFKNRQRVPGFVSALVKNAWFDMAIQLLEKSIERVIIKVTKLDGEALIHWNANSGTYHYEAIRGNPLQLPPELHSKEGKLIPLTSDMIERATRNGNYPDSIIRLVNSIRSEQFDFPDLILTLKDGYYLNNSLGKMTPMYRTHGSLSRGSSLGIVASNARSLPAFLRSRQILPFFGIKPEQLFGQVGEISQKSSRQTIDDLKSESSKGIPTGAREFSDKKIFQLITKVVSTSRPFFVVSEIKEFMSAFSFGGSVASTSGKGFSIHRFDPSALNSKTLIDPVAIGELTDLAIRNPDIKKLKADGRVQKIIENLGIPVDLLSDSQGLPDSKTKSLATKRAAMKIYQIPYLLDQTLSFQEKSFLTETRDLEFASYWNTQREKFLKKTEALGQQGASNLEFWKKTSTESIGQRLFREIFKEADVEERISPQPLNLIYTKSPEKLTVVYVPGTYNGIFDQEIFSLGLLTLKEDLGLRVLKAPMLSACSSEVNGDILLRFLKEDQLRFTERKESPPKYLLWGYSKGTVDALYALIKDKDFALKNIKGLLAIASPLKGSPILEKADLPFFIVNLLIDENTPDLCKKEKPATSSVSTQGMSSFWRKHEKELVGLTRYFSVSFVADPEDSHLFMKITKMMAQFEEDNDGVVGLSSSRFPPSLLSLDLGIVRADHLSGTLSSRFNQKAFMRALARNLAEVGIENEDVLKQLKLKSLLGMAESLYNGKETFDIDPASGVVKKRSYINGNSVAIASEDLSYSDPYDLNKRLFSQNQDPLAFYDSQTKLLPNQLEFDPYKVLDLGQMPEILSTKKVTPATPQNLKDGIDLSFNHTDVSFYRVDHQFMYESRSPVGGDNNPNWGFQSVSGPDGSSWLAMRSKNNSIRLTTLAYRFRPVDFPNSLISLKVTQGPLGADPVKGKSGKDDSAFQVWFTLRDLKGVADRNLGSKDRPQVFTFGYLWGEDVPNESRKSGEVFEDYYSNKNVVVTTLPPAFFVLLNNGHEDVAKVKSYSRNLAEDIHRAYPSLDVNQLEVIAITLQMDSNDTGSDSEAFLKTLKFSPQVDLGLNINLTAKH